MATTSLSLSPHFEAYIKKQVESGRYASASEVIRDALREHEARQEKLEKLRAHLKEGSDQIERGEGITDIDGMFAEIIEEAIESVTA
ncbi:MAG: type II toxin-antitoxin system ParD family antitoxin [Pseudomonadota bacterium]